MRGTQLARAFGFSLLALWLIACASDRLSGGVYDNGVVRYRAEKPPAEWKPVDVDNADLAWHNPTLGAAILMNTHCEGVEDAPLEALTQHLTIGMTEREILAQRKFMHSGREALETEMTAKLDGVQRHMELLVIKKDGCVYDIVLDAPPDRFPAARAQYERLRDSFSIERRPGRN